VPFPLPRIAPALRLSGRPPLASDGGEPASLLRAAVPNWSIFQGDLENDPREVPSVRPSLLLVILVLRLCYAPD